MEPDRSTRLRLVEVQAPGGTLRIGGGLACVLAARSVRGAAARWIATAVVGPRPTGTDGTIEIAGRFVSVRSLPSPLLAPSAPSVVDREMLRAQWHAACTRRRDDLAAVHASRRLARHRTEAALDRARERAGVAPPDALEPHEVHGVREVHDTLEAHDRIAALVAALAALTPVPSPDAVALAREWESYTAAAGATRDEATDVDRAAAQSHLNAARIGLALASGGIPTEARDRIESLHRAVVEAEAAVFDARRKDRPAAMARYEAALVAERDVLAGAGIDSYASFLLAIAEGARPPDREARRQAIAALEAAERELERAQHVESVPAATPIPAREIELRAHTAEILGHLPGRDPAAELRAHRIPPRDAAALRAELCAALEAVRLLPAWGDPLVVAQSYLDGPAAAREVPNAADAVDAEIVALARDRDEHERVLAVIDAELTRLDAVRDADLEALRPDDLALAMGGLLDGYRAGDILGGRFPVVLDGVLDGLDAPARDAAVAALGAAPDVQAIVVTGDPLVADAMSEAGARLVAWPEPVPQVSAVPAVAVPPIGPRCDVHADVAAVGRCARCRAAGCVDCLVDVLGEPDVWCRACAVTASAGSDRNLRPLHRRGA